jgi:hypothetical protein
MCSLTEAAMFIASPATTGSNATRTVGLSPEADKVRLTSPSLERNLNATITRGSVASRCNDNKVPNVEEAPARADRAAEEAVVVVEEVVDPRARLYM